MSTYTVDIWFIYFYIWIKINNIITTATVVAVISINFNIRKILVIFRSLGIIWLATRWFCGRVVGRTITIWTFCWCRLSYDISWIFSDMKIIMFVSIIWIFAIIYFLNYLWTWFMYWLQVWINWFVAIITQCKRLDINFSRWGGLILRYFVVVLE